MTSAHDPGTSAEPTTDGSGVDAQGVAAARKRRAQVFGEVLPEATSDERGDAWGDREPDSEEWLRRQVPPHHG